MLIILDRDGVINEDSSDYIKAPEEWHVIAGSIEAIVKLKQAGHQVVVATNQSGVGRGYYSEQTLQAIHQKMHDLLAQHGVKLDAIYYCPHKPEDGCDCRKPKPGLLQQIKNDFNTDFSDAILIGDSWRDIQAAKAMQCAAVLVLTGKGQTTFKEHQSEIDFPVYKNLAAWVDTLL
jgi:D-glycero-D-manno-heptose 1,7-bisphosphate phosphatase